MYRFDLAESRIPAQTDDAVLETTVGGQLRDMAARRGNRTALVEVDLDGENGRSWTYGKLLADSERLAKALASRFVPGERLVVWAPNVPEWVLMEYACGLSGLILVTANPSYQTAELRYVLEQSGASALFSVESYRGNPMAEIAIAAADGLSAVRSSSISTMSRRFIASEIGRWNCPRSCRTMRRRSSTPPARPASPRGPCCPTGRSPTMRATAPFVPAPDPTRSGRTSCRCSIPAAAD